VRQSYPESGLRRGKREDSQAEILHKPIVSLKFFHLFRKSGKKTINIFPISGAIYREEGVQRESAEM
jgi:hypothetical protein